MSSIVDNFRRLDTLCNDCPNNKKVFLSVRTFSFLFSNCGLNSFNASVFQQDVCKFAKENVDGSSVKSLHYASCISKFLGNCKVCKGVNLYLLLSATGVIVQ